MRKITVFIITISGFLGLLAFNTVFNAVRINLPSFENSAKSLLKKSEVLSKKAETFDEKVALKKLGMNSINGFYYRFDEHIKEAICEGKNLGNKDKIQKDPASFSFEFDGNDALEFNAEKGKFVLEKGLLKLKYVKADYLQSTGDLDIPKDDIGEIELRMKLKKGKTIKFGWSKYVTNEWGNWRKVGLLTIHPISGNAFHTYRINTKNALRKCLDYGDSIKKVFLVPSNFPNDNVEIDYIRFISKKEKYSKEPYNQTYETINKEMRKVLYASTPLSLKYMLDIPEERPFLEFGMGILEEKDPVKFRVLVKCENTQKELFSKEIINADEWHDARVDFSEWCGKRVEISFQTESEKGNIAFWSNPIIHTPPKERFNAIIVLEDALRADYMSCYGYSRKTTPVKDEFVKNGVLFFNAFSQATRTRPSCPSIMTSLYPTATDVWNFSDILDDKYLTLAEVMRGQGFATASFIQNGNAGPFNGLHQGFDNLFDYGAIGYRAEEIYGKKLYEWMEANVNRNFFIYLHLLDPHSPYDPPKPFDVWYKEAPPGKIRVKKHETCDPEWVKTPTLEGRRLLYDGEIRYNDFYFGKFLEKLKENKLLRDTLIIFIADHGEHLGEHPPLLTTHGPPGYIQVLHVPFFMVYPKKLPKDVKIAQPVQLIDIMPTILDLADIDKSELLMEGDSLLSLVYGENLNFWNNRLSFSEEVRYKTKGSRGKWASIFYKNWHIINSNRLKDGLSKLKPYRKTYKTPFTIRVFNYFEDGEEKHYLNSFLFDMFLNYKVKSFVRKLQENNMTTWKRVTKGTKETAKYDTEELEHLRALGYLQ